MLWQHEMSCMCIISLLDRKKDTLNKTNYNFLTFMIIKFSVQTLKCTETQILYFFANENMEKTTPQSRILLQNSKNFQYCPDGPIWQKTKRYKIYLSFYGIWDR